MCLPGLFGQQPQPAPPPAPPPPPPAPPPPPERSSVEASQASVAQRQQAAAAEGTRQGTLLTGPTGILDDDEDASRKQLLGN
jgi:hypothetical protein